MEQGKTAQAHANIALIKYWGKRDEKLFLPTKSSLSISLPQLITTTHITQNTNHPSNVFILNGKELGGKEHEKLQKFVDLFRAHYVPPSGLNPTAGCPKKHLLVHSENSFPTAAGLASSASGFAALAKSLNNFYGLNLPPRELSVLARQGSGSASRSIQEGFVIWHKGAKPDGTDSFAEQLYPPTHWPELCVLVCMIDTNKKKISSRTAMQQTVNTSPLYHEWVTRSEKRIEPMIEAIKTRNFCSLGELAEADALEMHACMRTTTPSINYFLPETHKAITLAQQLRARGTPCYVTIDAGPNVKIITLKSHVSEIVEAYDIMGLCIRETQSIVGEKIPTASK